VITANYGVNTFSVATSPAGLIVNSASAVQWNGTATQAVAMTTDLTAGTVQRMPDGQLFDFLDRINGQTIPNWIYTTSASRPALRAADAGTFTWSSFLTKEQSFRDWDIRVRYRPANDATTTSTDYSFTLTGCFIDDRNCWSVIANHGSGNPNMQMSVLVNNNNGNSAGGYPAPVSPMSSSTDRVCRIRKEGDYFLCKDWSLAVIEPDWQRCLRYRQPYYSSSPTLTVDNPERGACGIRQQLFGGYILEFNVTEIVRQSENLLHNADLSKIDLNGKSADTAKQVSLVAATGVFTTPSAHGYAIDDLVVFGGSNSTVPNFSTNPLYNGRDYYVKTVPSSTTFTVAATRGGTGIGTFNLDITTATQPEAYVIRNPVPTWWMVDGSALLSGNSMEIHYVAGPNGDIRPAISVVCVTPNDPHLLWTQYMWNPVNQSGASAIVQRQHPHPQSEMYRRMEFSCWVKSAVTAIQTSGLGITFDVYIYETAGAIMMQRATYHPGLSPTALVDPAPDVCSYDGAEVVSTFGWTYLRSIVELASYQSVVEMRAQILFHESVDTGNVLVMDPCLRPIG
jgi:hypothetical protein